MARRKYRRRVSGVEQAPLSEAGQSEKPANDTPQGPEQRPLDAPQPPAQEPATVTPQAVPTNDAAMSLKDQLDVLQQRASADDQHIAAQAATPLEQQLEQIAGLSVAQKAYLRVRPHALTRPDVLQAAHHYALQNQVPIDSPTYFQILDHALNLYGNVPFTTPPTASPTETPTHEPRPAPMPQATDDSYSPHIASAPPSRSEYAGSMPPPDASNSRVTLSAAEREVAALSGVSEVEYAKNKLKLQQMKKAGLIRD